jgi:plastocyanin
MVVLGIAMAVATAACGSDDNPTVQSDGTGTTSAGPGSGASPTTTAHVMEDVTCEPTGTTLQITAKDTAYDKNCLAVGSGQAIKVEFDNKDAAQHNLAILDTHEATRRYFTGDIITGPQKDTYDIPVDQLPPPGSYHFHCDVHPNTMKGTFIVKG